MMRQQTRIKRQQRKKLGAYPSPILLDGFMSIPQIIAWYSRGDMVGYVNINIVAKDLNPVKQNTQQL